MLLKHLCLSSMSRKMDAESTLLTGFYFKKHKKRNVWHVNSKNNAICLIIWMFFFKCSLVLLELRLWFDMRSSILNHFEKYILLFWFSLMVLRLLEQKPLTALKGIYCWPLNYIWKCIELLAFSILSNIKQSFTLYCFLVCFILTKIKI